MVAQQHVCCKLHRICVQRMFDLPDIACVKSKRRSAADEFEKVTPFGRREPCVPIICDDCAIYDGYGGGFEVEV